VTSWPPLADNAPTELDRHSSHRWEASALDARRRTTSSSIAGRLKVPSITSTSGKNESVFTLLRTLWETSNSCAHAATRCRPLEMSENRKVSMNSCSRSLPRSTEKQLDSVSQVEQSLDALRRETSGASKVWQVPSPPGSLLTSVPGFVILGAVITPAVKVSRSKVPRRAEAPQFAAKRPLRPWETHILLYATGCSREALLRSRARLARNLRFDLRRTE
jgi:hypothetical protein